ncbi:MAG: hypothetical protein V4471_07485 [Pseudomonadota bacterium]
MLKLQANTPELQASFKYSLRLPDKNTAILMTVISVGNSLQQGVSFSPFVNLVNQEFKEGTLEKLIIVTTGYLQRHYFSLGLDKPLDEKILEEKANVLDNVWLTQNKDYLKQFKLPVEIKSWKAVLELGPVGEFTDFLQTLKNHYQENKSFNRVVTKHARQYVARKITKYLSENGRNVEFDAFMKVAIDYILEELAAIVQLRKCNADFFTYPSQMNPPACHVVKHFAKETDLKYVQYEISELKKVSTLFFQSRHVSAEYAQWSLNQVNWNYRQEFQFLQGFHQLLDSINTLTVQPESISSTTTIPRRVSL